MTRNRKINYFPKYDKLNFIEKFFLNTCCYFPPRPRRKIDANNELDLSKHKNTFKSAFGKNILNDLENCKVLDFGCGEGGFSLMLASELNNSKIVGIDIFDRLDIVKKKINDAEQMNNIEFVIGSSNKLLENSFDYVFTHDSFEHFENPQGILAEMVRLVKPGGNILIKFGPTWLGPYGRHMGGTIKKTRPWVHLLFSEKTIMRVHSVYHNRNKLYSEYKDLEGGLNKMTIKKAFKIIHSFNDCEVLESEIKYLWKGENFNKIPLLNELFSSSLFVKLSKNPII